MKGKLIALLFFLAIPASAIAGRCWQEASYYNPDPYLCTQIGTTQMGVPIWSCCEY